MNIASTDQQILHACPVPLNARPLTPLPPCYPSHCNYGNEQTHMDLYKFTCWSNVIFYLLDSELVSQLKPVELVSYWSNVYLPIFQQILSVQKPGSQCVVPVPFVGWAERWLPKHYCLKQPPESFELKNNNSFIANFYSVFMFWK